MVHRTSESRLARLLVAEDEPSIRETLRAHFTELGYEVVVTESATAALNRIDEFEPDLVLSDVEMPGMSGLELLQHLREASPLTDVIIFTGHADVSGAIKAMKAGAADYLVKPLDLDETESAVERCLAKRQSAAATAHGREDARLDAAYGLVGQHPSMIQMYKEIGSVAEFDAPVLIRGETGSGKELVAKAIHNASGRLEGPFIGVNCAAMPSELLESELFGHVKGAFTGALSDRRGKFEMAGGGTLFLDEIGDTSPAFQAKLLRVLQEREFYRVGDDRPKTTDARIIAATHRPLEQMVAKGTFRQDLLFRLKVIVIPVPALKERRTDIPLLVRYLVARAAHKAGKTPPVVPPSVMESLMWREWPGNVRELENVITRALVMSRGPALTLEDVGAPTAEGAPDESELGLPAQSHPLSLSDVRAEVERSYVRQVLQDTGGNKSQAARVLQISRPTLNRIIEDHQLAVR
ncbi:MAG TPA: sigma-54 dependent transcriptional regulator [Longimicrobiales bacterium]|nr:sigma-54 dependent transcriptional regulator [Longimicrobiales bacterium]